MNDQHVKGTLKDLKGKVKEEVGHLTGNNKTAVKGLADQVAGKVQKAWGDVKDSAKEKADRTIAKNDSSKKSYPC